MAHLLKQDNERYVSDAQNRLKERNFKKTRTLFVKFGLVQLVWTVHLTMFFIIQNGLQLQGTWVSMLSETNRCLLYVIPPIVHLLLTENLRSALKKWLFRQHHH